MVWLVGKCGCYGRSFSCKLARGYFCPPTIRMKVSDEERRKAVKRGIRAGMVHPLQVYHPWALIREEGEKC